MACGPCRPDGASGNSQGCSERSERNPWNTAFTRTLARTGRPCKAPHGRPVGARVGGGCGLPGVALSLHPWLTRCASYLGREAVPRRSMVPPVDFGGTAMPPQELLLWV